MKLLLFRPSLQVSQWAVSRVDGLPTSQEKVAVWEGREFARFRMVPRDSAQTSSLTSETRKRLLQTKSSEVLALTMGRRQVSSNTPSNGSMGLRIHGTCVPPEACGVSMNARLYESSNGLELQIDWEKGDKFTSSNTKAVREARDSSRAANRSARRCADSGPHVAQAIAWILQDAIAISLWKAP